MTIAVQIKAAGRKVASCGRPLLSLLGEQTVGHCPYCGVGGLGTYGSLLVSPLCLDQRSLRRNVAVAAPLYWEAAQRLYRDSGMLPTVLDIARAAGMAKGAVYLWFRTKDEIFVALLDANFEMLITRPAVRYPDSRPPSAR